MGLCCGFPRLHFTLSQTSVFSYPHRMGKITVRYYAAAMDAARRASDTFDILDDGLKLSDLAELIVSRHPNTGIGAVLEQTRWIVDGQLIYRYDSFVLEDGEEVVTLPHVVGG